MQLPNLESPTLMKAFAVRSKCFLATCLILGGSLVLGRAADTDVLAKGKGVAVTQADLDEAFVNLRGTLAAQGRQLQDAQRPVLEQQLVEKLALTQILLSRASDEDRKKAKEKATRLINEEKAKARTQARFEAQIRAAGMAPEQFEKQLNERAICEEVLDRELRPSLGVTPEKVRAFYDQNLPNFRQPERVRLQQVVFSLRGSTGIELTEGDKLEKKSLATRVLERAKKGEDIAQLAKDFSDDPAGRERGGEYVFPVGRMVPEFEVAVAGMKTNVVADLVVTPFGYHVVKLLERMPGEQIPFDIVSTNLKARLELEATQQKLPEFQKRLFTESGVEVVAKKP